MENITAGKILEYMKVLVESKKPIPKEDWLNAAGRLNILRLDEAMLLNKMNQEVAKRKLEILGRQEKRNVAAAEAEIESLDEYRLMKDQEQKLYTIDEFVRIAKKNADTTF